MDGRVRIQSRKVAGINWRRVEAAGCWTGRVVFDYFVAARRGAVLGHRSAILSVRRTITGSRNGLISAPSVIIGARSAIIGALGMKFPLVPKLELGNEGGTGKARSRE